MKPAQKFINVMLAALKIKFPELADKIDEFTHIMWYESADLTEEEHKAINNFIEFCLIKLLNN